MEIVLAVASAFLFALGTVLQQRAGAESPSTGASAGRLLQMVRRRVWLAGIACDGLGLVAQAAALGIGRLAVVQPLLISSVVFALPLGVRLSGQRVRPVDVGAAAVVAAALVGFLVVADPSGGRSEAPVGAWLVAGAASAAVCAPLVWLGRRGRGGADGSESRRAALVGSAAGILFALSAALIKAVVDELHTGIVHVVTSWELYALGLVGYASMTLNQIALDTGELAATVATSTALDPIASVVLGLTLFRESLHATVVGTAVTVVALLVALAGITVLARDEAAAVPRPAREEAPAMPRSTG